MVLGPTPERQPLVCSWRLEGNLAVTHKFSTSTLCVSSLLSLCDTLQRSRARASERLRRACRFVLPSDSFALPRTEASNGRPSSMEPSMYHNDEDDSFASSTMAAEGSQPEAMPASSTLQLAFASDEASSTLDQINTGCTVCPGGTGRNSRVWLQVCIGCRVYVYVLRTALRVPEVCTFANNNRGLSTTQFHGRNASPSHSSHWRWRTQ